MLPIVQNILDQPASLRGVIAYQFGNGLDSLHRAAEILAKSKQVVISGMGASLFSALPFTYQLNSQGIVTLAPETSELLYFLQQPLRGETAVVLVSRSGESIETLRLLPSLRSRGCSIIAITNVPGSTLAEEADECILLGSQADELVAIQTYTGTVLVLALLAAAVLGDERGARFEAEIAVDCAARILPELATRSALSQFTDDSPLYLLGRGPSLGSVHESVLLMHEVAKTPAIGMSTAAFRHGPVEVLYRKIKAVVFSTTEQTMELDRTLASDIAGRGAQVGWIGPGMIDDPAVMPLCEWPTDAPTRFAPLLEILPVQWLAVKVAEANGIRPGEFRFAPAITASETGFLPTIEA